jgi:hypothetical protein
MVLRLHRTIIFKFWLPIEYYVKTSSNGGGHLWFLITYICICTFFVAIFSATIDGRNLMFGHKLHIGTPYCGKRFFTRQIPTSCLPKSGGIIGNKIGKQEVGIWCVQKSFPRYGVPIWSLWPNIRFLPSIVAEKNVTKNVHICSMWYFSSHFSQ